MATMYKFYFSAKKAALDKQTLPSPSTKHILIDGEWVEYTYCTTESEPTAKHDDLEFLGEFNWESVGRKINGVIQ